jgi:Tfp pilus assembly protein PilV
MKKTSLFIVHYLSQKLGQSLIEVVVSVSVISLILVTLVSAITFSMSNTQYAKSKAIATKHAQEAVEFIRSQRDENWLNVYSHSNNSPGSKYCLKSLGWPAGTGSCTSTDYITNTNYLREVILSRSGTDRINVNVIVYWIQGSHTSQVTVDSILTNWD